MSGHYTLPLTMPCQILQEMESSTQGSNIKVTLLNVNKSDKKKNARKLHSQFAHPPANKLIKLLVSAGEPWANDAELKKEILKVSEECQTCQVYKKPPPRPVVGLPLASTFLECVAMDLKFFEKHILLHLIDHATRLSQSCRIP